MDLRSRQPSHAVILLQVFEEPKTPAGVPPSDVFVKAIGDMWKQVQLKILHIEDIMLWWMI